MAPDVRIDLPEGVRAALDDGSLTITGPKGEVSRRFDAPGITLKVESGGIIMSARGDRRALRALMGTWEGHLRNMVHGVVKEFVYRMKVVYKHFPIKVSVKGSTVVIENFQGERSQRRVEVVPGTRVEVKGDTLTLRGVDIEAVGTTAGRIEYATRIKGKDPRVFQDGIYLVEKGRRD